MLQVCAFLAVCAILGDLLAVCAVLGDLLGDLLGDMLIGVFVVKAIWLLWMSRFVGWVFQGCGLAGVSCSV